MSEEKEELKRKEKRLERRILTNLLIWVLSVLVLVISLTNYGLEEIWITGLGLIGLTYSTIEVIKIKKEQKTPRPIQNTN